MIDFSTVTDIMLGNQQVTQIEDSLGNVLWSGTPTPPAPTTDEYFYVEDISGSDNTLSIKKSSSNAPTIEVFKSTDGTNWSSIGNTDTTAITATVPANSKLYLKAVADKWGTGDSNYNTISMVSYFNVGGNTMSLLYGDNFENRTTFPTTNNNVFPNLFKNTQVVSAANLELPATTLVIYCYYGMFRDCSALTTAPVTLPATTLVLGCYQQMFDGCRNLNSVTTYAQDISASLCLDNWLRNVAATGDFYNMGGATYTSGASGIPRGWTEHTSL